MNQKPRYKLVRPLPYPYKAGLAISNDAEFMSANFFDGLMAFLNSSKPTPLGNGLNLEVTSSAFFYSAHPYNFSYFRGAKIKGVPTAFAGRMKDYLKSGLIDTLHAYGDFDGVGGFLRGHAERALDTLEQLNVVIPIYTNHGDIANRQNIGGDASYHQGDIPNTPCYHTDLLKLHGTRYIWTDTAIFGEPNEQNIGWKRYISRRSYNQSTPLLTNWKLQDGQNMKRFVRFRGTGGNAPNLSSLGYQIDKLDLPDLYINNKITVLYQHLGIQYRSGGKCVAATFEAMLERPEIYLAPWYFLAKEVGEGRLWLSGLARVLQYQDMLSSINVEVDKAGSIELKTDKTIIDPSENFQGLTIYVEPRMEPIVTYKKQKLLINHNGPDESGRYSVSIPLKKAQKIW